MTEQIPKNLAKVAAPILRWAGSKRQLVPNLQSHWNSSCTSYLEPFAGSACLFLAMAPPAGKLNDINPHLIRTYRALQKHSEAIYERLIKMPINKEYYYSLRPIAFDTNDDIELASNFIYLNRNCFNGLYRTNLSGVFNVPHSNSRTAPIPQKEAFFKACDVLSLAELHSTDFEVFVRKNVAPNSFVYLDPPYAVSNRRIFRQYGPSSFGLHDVDRLSELLNFIENRGARFLLSYADCKEARAIARQWTCRRVLTKRNIAGFHDRRRRAAELLISNT